MVFVPLDRGQALFGFVENPGHALVVEGTPSARGVDQTVEAISILRAGAVLIGLEILKGKDLGIFILTIMGDFHFAGMSVAGGYHSLGFKV